MRLVVVESSALVPKADASIAHDLDDAARRVDRAAKRLSRQRFDCEADARRAWERWQKETKALAWWHVTATLDSLTRRRRRPEGGPLETVTEWVWTIQRGDANQAFVDHEHLDRRTFVLVAHDPQRSAEELLTAYNHQCVAEGNHATVKDPLSSAPVFLKNPKKLTAYVYVVYMAALLWSVMQAVARRTAAQQGVTLPYPNRQLQDAPTTKRIKELLTPITIVRYRQNDITYRAMQELTWVQRLACLLLEVEPRRLMGIPSG